MGSDSFSFQIPFSLTDTICVLTLSHTVGPTAPGPSGQGYGVVHLSRPRPLLCCPPWWVSPRPSRAQGSYSPLSCLGVSKLHPLNSAAYFKHLLSFFSLPSKGDTAYLNLSCSWMIPNSWTPPSPPQVLSKWHFVASFRFAPSLFPSIEMLPQAVCLSLVFFSKF